MPATLNGLRVTRTSELCETGPHWPGDKHMWIRLYEENTQSVVLGGHYFEFVTFNQRSNHFSISVLISGV
jgi:hypothetical protein